MKADLFVVGAVLLFAAVMFAAGIAFGLAL
jgi:hypothetical protein